MDINSHDSKEKLKSQIMNAYGKVCYSLTSHEKEIQHLVFVKRTIKISQIILSAVSAGTIISVVFGQGFIATVIASIVSLLLLILNSFSLKFDISSDINRHENTTNKLWIVREEYVSLLTDFNDLDIKDIRLERDKLLYRTSEVYSESPKTSSRSYKKSQKALKIEEEQFFTVEELHQLLPPELRK